MPRFTELIKISFPIRALCVWLPSVRVVMSDLSERFCICLCVCVCVCVCVCLNSTTIRYGTPLCSAEVVFMLFRSFGLKFLPPSLLLLLPLYRANERHQSAPPVCNRMPSRQRTCQAAIVDCAHLAFPAFATPHHGTTIIGCDSCRRFERAVSAARQPLCVCVCVIFCSCALLLWLPHVCCCEGGGAHYM